jgi:hypothetical protein
MAGGDAAVVPWYLAGGVDPANCVGAYQAKGAASLAASKVNLVNPGTYDLSSTADPTFDTTTGWYFILGKHLQTGITPTSTYSFVGRLNGVEVSTWRSPCGLWSAANGKYNIAWNGSNWYISVGSGDVNSTSTATSGVFAIINRYLYVDAVKKTASQAGAAANSLTFSMGAPTADAGYGNNCVEYCLAFALYSSVLTEEQLSAITTAMAAL